MSGCKNLCVRMSRVGRMRWPVCAGKWRGRHRRGADRHACASCSGSIAARGRPPFVFQPIGARWPIAVAAAWAHGPFVPNSIATSYLGVRQQVSTTMAHSAPEGSNAYFYICAGYAPEHEIQSIKIMGFRYNHPHFVLGGAAARNDVQRCVWKAMHEHVDVRMLHKNHCRRERCAPPYAPHIYICQRFKKTLITCQVCAAICATYIYIC